MIIGSSGSGKSTFAGKSREKTGLPLFCLDMIKHKPDRISLFDLPTEVCLEGAAARIGRKREAPSWIETEDTLAERFRQWIEEFSIRFMSLWQIILL